MKKAALVIAGLFLAVGCTRRSETVVTGTTAPETVAEIPVTVSTATSTDGSYLTDPSGRTLYVFSEDKASESHCYEECATEWPPFEYEGDLTAGPGAQTSLLSTMKRNNGSTQITYSGHPLYYYAKDQAPGEAKGQDVRDSGGEWYLISPAGETIESQTAAAGETVTTAHSD